MRSYSTTLFPHGTIFIYALTDPFSLELRYVGKTIHPRERMINEWNDHANTHRCHWIQSIIAKGARPLMTFLEVLPPDANWQERERFWIAHYKALGYSLVNSTSGGDGVPDLSPESKARMLATWTGRKHRPETLAKIGAASRLRRHTPEWRARMSELMQQRVFTEQHRRRLSLGVRKLSNDQVREIRNRLTCGEKQYQIAATYNVDKGTISNIKRGLFYQDVPL